MMEKGDPAVSMAVYATALWLIGRTVALGELAAPAHDLGALESAVKAARVRAVHKRRAITGDDSHAQAGKKETTP